MAFFFYLFVPFITERISLSECCLVNFIKKGLIVVLMCCLLASYRCMEINGRENVNGVTAIFRQCVILQSKFNASGLHFPSRTKVTFTYKSFTNIFYFKRILFYFYTGSGIWMGNGIFHLFGCIHSSGSICIEKVSLVCTTRTFIFPIDFLWILGSFK